MPRPAHEILHPNCPVKPAWGVFDRGWYLHHYADARAVCAGKSEDAALLYYLRVGARLGHSPSALFDEVFYLARNPDIAELVRAGRYASGFDHYCQHGHRGASPHWLFDDALYADLYDDMTLENLDLHQCYGRYDHYLKSGQRERRLGHFLFDGFYYRARAEEAGIAPAEIDGPGPYVHYLARLGAGHEELAPSVYFDPAWYVEHHPGAKAEVLRGRFCAGIHHYLTNEQAENFDPVPQFSERFYRRRYPDIAAAIEAGLYRNAYQQFVQYGCFELRQPGPDIDLAYYRDMNERVRNDLNAGVVRDAFAHLRLVGLAENLPYSPPDAKPGLDEAATREAFIRQARAELALFARQKLDFSCEAPVLSVILVLFNKFELTMRALASLRRNFAGAVDLILVDNDSTDVTRRIGDYVLGVKILRLTSNVGFLRAANLGLAQVSAPALLYMNNDVELGFGAVAAALRRLARAADIGAVGGKIIRTNGVLQEAGSVIWNEGTAAGYLRDASPLVPEANFVRAVDFCSAVFLLCRTALVKELGGFDEDFAPAYYEDVDLCVRMLHAGYRVLYDPAVSLTHLEFGSAGTAEASMALMRRGRRIFRKKHQGFLQGQCAPGAQNMFLARSRGRAPRVLFIEDTVPLRRLGSGFVRSNDVVHGISQAGYEVHVFPMNGAPYDVMSLYGDLPEEAEILVDRKFDVLEEFLAARKGFYDVIWVARTHNLARILPVLAAAKIDFRRVRLILDTEAVAARRSAMQAALEGREYDFSAALAQEVSFMRKADTVVAVNEAEAALLRKHKVKNVQVLGTARDAAPTPASFAERAGLLFVGAIHEAGSPNHDSLRYYVERVLPALAREFGEPPMLHVVGHTAKDVDLSAFAKLAHVKLHGELGDISALYNSARVFIAPTRFAAGTPYKIYEAASFGLPCVASDVLAGQLGWADGEEVLVAPAGDAAEFARQIARLYGDEALWRRVREAALARLTREHRLEAFYSKVADILHAT